MERQRRVALEESLKAVAEQEIPVVFEVFTEAIEVLREQDISNDAILVGMSKLLEISLGACPEPFRTVYIEEIVRLLTGNGGQTH